MRDQSTNAPSAAPNEEVELKLLFRPQDLSRLRRLPAFRKAAAGRAETQRLISVYYDTLAQDLRNHLVTLRVRRKGQAFVQCVKSGGGRIGGMVARREWEGPVPTEDPVIPAIGDAALRRVVVDAAANGLAPIFHTDFMRTTRPLALADGTQVTACIDSGEIVADGSHQPLCELELELTSGAPHRLFDLALDIEQTLPVRLSTVSKAKRGFALLSGEEPTWEKFVRPELRPDLAVEEALIRCVQQGLNHLLANQACVLESADPEGIHQMRIALRRLRSALRVFRSLIPVDQYDFLTAEIRWCGGRLGTTRDWDVFADEIVGPVAARFPEEAGFAFLMRRIVRHRAASRRRAREAVRSRRYTRLVLELSAWLTGRGWRDQPVNETAVDLFSPVRDFADLAVERAYTKIRKKGRRFTAMSVAERHRLRIDIKWLRYSLDLFASLYPPKRLSSLAALLAKLQDDLGYANDVALAETMVDRLVTTGADEEAVARQRAGGVVIGWHAHALARSRRALARDIKRLVARKSALAGR